MCLEQAADRLGNESMEEQNARIACKVYSVRNIVTLHKQAIHHLVLPPNHCQGPTIWRCKLYWTKVALSWTLLTTKKAETSEGP